MRKDPLINDEYYHVFNRSIARYVIFNDDQDFLRFKEILNLCRYPDFNLRYSSFLDLTPEAQKITLERIKNSRPIVVIIAYILMPTHFHLILKQLDDSGISHYMARVLNSYARYFNTKYKRKGPLFEGKFKNILVRDDDQILHLTCYIHLNATSANLVKSIDDWKYSSYFEYIKAEEGLCEFEGLFNFEPKAYIKFINDRLEYQKKISLIKNLLIDDYIG